MKLDSKIEENGILKFTIDGIHVSIINAIRRTLLSEIPCYVMRTTPYEKDKCTIITNTTALTNELIKQRLQCIPIHIDDPEFPYDEYEIELDETNDTSYYKNITTEHFKIRNIATDKYLSEQVVHKIFPPNDITGDYILLAKLRPKMSDTIKGSALKFTCKFDIGKHSECSSFNVVSTCVYSFVRDEDKIATAKREYEKSLIDSKLDKSEIEYKIQDWMLLDANRLCYDNKFDFTIKSVSGYDNNTLMRMACDDIIHKLKKTLEQLQTTNGLITSIASTTTFNNGFDITLNNVDHTIGEPIKHHLYEKYYKHDKVLNFCTFNRPHPHLNYSILRLSFINTASVDNVLTMLTISIDELTKTFLHIRELFTSTK